MLLLPRSVTRIAYHHRCKSLQRAAFPQKLRSSTTWCERQRTSGGSMPTSSLNRFLSDRQTASNGARQRRIGLPEGALLGLRLKRLMFLSNPTRISLLTYVRMRDDRRARVPVIRACRRSNAKHRLFAAGLRTPRRRSATCRRTHLDHLAQSQPTRVPARRIAIPAGYFFCSGVSTISIPHVGLD